MAKNIASILCRNPDFAAQIAEKTAEQPEPSFLKKWTKVIKAAPLNLKKPRKYRNVPVERDGQKFDSQKECRNHYSLIALHGERNIMRQVSLKIGIKRMIIDHMRIMERYEDGSIRVSFMDTKGGPPTKEWTVKAAWLKDKHGIEIEVI